MLTNHIFRPLNNLLSYVGVIVFIFLIWFISEEVIDFKLLLAISFSFLMTSLLSPYAGVALWPIPGVSFLRSSLHLMETTGIPENQIIFHNIKSIFIFLLQTFVALSVFLFSTTRFMLN